MGKNNRKKLKIKNQNYKMIKKVKTKKVNVKYFEDLFWEKEYNLNFNFKTIKVKLYYCQSQKYFLFKYDFIFFKYNITIKIYYA